MPQINVEQGSNQWLELRRFKITATDISVIIETNPFKTPLELWEEKLGIRAPQKTNAAMERGQRLEPEARELACNQIGMDFKPCVWESDQFPWAMASLDGYCLYEPENTDLKETSSLNILEIKCPKAETHDDALDGKITPYYSDQIQWQLMVAQADMCYYFSYRPERTDKPYAIIEIYPDLEKQQQMILRAQEFHIQLCTFQPPTTWTLNTY